MWIGHVPWRDSEADVSSVSPSLEGVDSLTLPTQLKKQNILREVIDRFH